MPPLNFNLLVLGAGSGGLACARKAAELGAKVGLIENSKIGGTCVSFKNEFLNVLLTFIFHSIVFTCNFLSNRFMFFWFFLFFF